MAARAVPVCTNSKASMDHSNRHEKLLILCHWCRGMGTTLHVNGDCPGLSAMEVGVLSARYPSLPGRFRVLTVSSLFSVVPHFSIQNLSRLNLRVSRVNLSNHFFNFFVVRASWVDVNVFLSFPPDENHLRTYVKSIDMGSGSNLGSESVLILWKHLRYNFIFCDCISWAMRMRRV